ncbi:MAG: hypothetical protein FJZ43_02860 [Candidatus Staskawiczbacteria bacterium]|nr:hypothetical protein [Candidatus Staskawiczbacteria bacterium]
MLKNFLMWYLGVRIKVDEHGFKKTYVPVPLDLSRRAGLTGMFLLALSYFLINLTFYKLNGMDSRNNTNQSRTKKQTEETFLSNQFNLDFSPGFKKNDDLTDFWVDINIKGFVQKDQILLLDIEYPNQKPKTVSGIDEAQTRGRGKTQIKVHIDPQKNYRQFTARLRDIRTERVIAEKRFEFPPNFPIISPK